MSNFPRYYVWALNKQGNSILSTEQNGIKYDDNSLSSMIKLADTAIACGLYDKAFVVQAEHVYFTSDKIHKQQEPENKKTLKSVINNVLGGVINRKARETT